VADAPAATTSGSSGGKTIGSTVTRKIGPLPLWGWVAIGFGAYYWYTHYGPGSSGSSTAAGQQAQGQAGDFLVNVGQRIGGTGSTTTTTAPDKDKTTKPTQKHKCPRGYFWDPDDRGGKGRCVPDKHKGPDRPGSDKTGKKGGGTGPPTVRKDQDKKRTVTTRGGGQPSQNVTVEATPYGGYPYQAYATQAPGAATQGNPVVATTEGNPLYQSWDPNSPYTAPLDTGSGTYAAYAPQTAGAIYQGGNGTSPVPSRVPLPVDQPPGTPSPVGPPISQGG
jgi:hypothetical protein